MVSLVHLYRNSVGGLIDAEARRLLTDEFESLEDKRWKWMFARSDEVSGETAGAVAFSDTAAMSQGTVAEGVNTSLTAAKPGLPGSSRYLLFEQVPVNDPETSTKLIPSYRQEKAKYACHIYAYSDLRDWNAEGGKAGPMSSDPRSNFAIPGIDTSINLAAIGDTAPLSYDPMHQIDFGVTNTGVNDSVLSGRTRKCMYQLVAGTPLNGLIERNGDEGFKENETRVNAIRSVSDPIPGDGPFNPKRTRQLGSAGVYDGIGRPSSAWFARARFKAFMETVNKKRRVDASEPEYDMRDVNGYIADTINRREEIAIMYPRAERIKDACEVVNLAASCIVGEATTDWFVEKDPLNGMSFENRLRLVLPPHKLTGEEAKSPVESASAYYCHSYVSDADDFAHLFPNRNPPPNPGHNAEARHAHLARLATAGIRRSKRPTANLVPQRPFERRIYSRSEDSDAGVCVLSRTLLEKSEVPEIITTNEKAEYVGCGFSECVVEPLCRGGTEAADGLVDAVADFVTMFKDTESEFATHASDEFLNRAFGDDTQTEFVLVPADPDSLPCGEVCIDEEKYWMVGATPASLSCAAKLALTYVTSTGILETNVPQNVDEENMMHAKDAIEKLATNARYAKDFDESKHGSAKMLEEVTHAGMSTPLEQGSTEVSMAMGVGLGAGAAYAILSLAKIIASNADRYDKAKQIVNYATETTDKIEEARQEMEDLKWMPKTSEEYYSRLYAVVFWVILGKNDDPDKKEMFEKLMKCADPTKLKEINSKNGNELADLINSGKQIQEKPGIVSQLFTLGTTTIMNNPGTALMCVTGVGAAGALGMYALQNFSIAAAAPYLKQGLDFLKTPEMLREEREHALGLDPNVEFKASDLQIELTKNENLKAELLTTRRQNNGVLTDDEALDLALAESEIASLRPRVSRLYRMISSSASETYEQRVLGRSFDRYSGEAAAAESNNNLEVQGSSLIKSALFDEKWAGQRQQLWNVFTRYASKFV